MTELTPVVLLGILVTTFGWLLHEMHRLRDLLAELQKDIVAIRILVEHAERKDDISHSEPHITRIRMQ